MDTGGNWVSAHAYELLGLKRSKVEVSLLLSTDFPHRIVGAQAQQSESKFAFVFMNARASDQILPIGNK